MKEVQFLITIDLNKSTCMRLVVRASFSSICIINKKKHYIVCIICGTLSCQEAHYNFVYFCF